jgi:hypothetical protein
LDARTLEAIAIGVSTRKYRRSLDPLPSEQCERSVGGSSVSRRFVTLSSQLLAKWMNRALDRLDLRVVTIGYAPFVHVERAELARLTGDEATRERELREAHRLFIAMGATIRAEQVAKELAG